MKIFNVRKYFATNSSSSHSILVLKGEDLKGTHMKLKDKSNPGSYGWDNFTLVSPEAKESYLAWSVQQAYYEILRSNKNYDEIEDGYVLLDQESREKTAEIFPNLKEELLDSDNSGVDHQSWLLIPTNYEHTDIEHNYLKELKNYFLQDEVVIVGGNDNDDNQHALKIDNLYTESLVEKLPKETSNFAARHSYVVKENGEIDTTQGFWTLFNRFDGTKYRLTFDDSIQEINKSAAPELADICITSYCTFGCEFCYQDSTPEGSHASFEDLERIAKSLSQAQVQEVAFGGGDPTLHPQFNDIIRMFHDNHIVVNFTTKNLAYFKKAENREVLKNVGAFAFSISTAEDVLKLKTVVDAYPELERLANIQYVMGTSSMEDFEEVLQMCVDTKIKATLLGYKQNGRGDSFETHDYSRWLEVVKKMTEENHLELSIDTQLAGQSKKEIKKLGISDYTFHTKEGAHSVYIDAVKMTFAPSSYVGLEQAKDFTENWLNDYLTMGAEADTQKPKRKIKIKS